MSEVFVVALCIFNKHQITINKAVREIKKYIPKDSLKCSSFTLVLAVYGLAGVGWDPVPQDRRVPALQGDGQATPLFFFLFFNRPGVDGAVLQTAV